MYSIYMFSCITHDFLDDQDQYYEGAISPGLNMRFKAMHEQKQDYLLIQLDQEDEVKLIGNSIKAGLQSGVFQGIKFKSEGFIKSMSRQHQDFKVIICGGDSKFFESLTKDHIFVIPNLVLYGLNRILTYNVNKK